MLDILSGLVYSGDVGQRDGQHGREAAQRAGLGKKVEMQHKFEDGIEDVAAAIASGGGVKTAGPYRLLIGDESFNYRAVVVRSPTVNGAQVLMAYGIENLVEYVAFQVLHGGALESLRPDESVDLRTAGVERFMVFRSDRTFRLLVDDKTLDWGAARITAATIQAAYRRKSSQSRRLAGAAYRWGPCRSRR